MTRCPGAWPRLTGDTGKVSARPVQARELGFELPERFAVGMLFLRRDGNGDKRRTVEAIAAQRGLRFLGWREVPVDTSILGWRATETVPLHLAMLPGRKRR